MEGTVTITWTTDVASSSQVAYGPTTGYGSLSLLDGNRVTSHSVTLTGLPAGLYHYCTHSRDSAGNDGVSADGTFLVTRVLGWFT